MRAYKKCTKKKPEYAFRETKPFLAIDSAGAGATVQEKRSRFPQMHFCMDAIGRERERENGEKHNNTDPATPTKRDQIIKKGGNVCSVQKLL